MNIINVLRMFFVIPHYYVYKYLPEETKLFVNSDVEEMNRRLKKSNGLIYYLALHRPYRNLFYYRIGHNKARWLKLFAKDYPQFYISYDIEHIGKNAFVLNHPYCTIINAKYIGDNFTVCQLTTLGNKQHGRNDLIPTIGNDVSIGANVNIMGNVKIGNNVTIGAGSVVVKDVPDNCVVAGNPAKVIRNL